MTQSVAISTSCLVPEFADTEDMPESRVGEGRRIGRIQRHGLLQQPSGTGETVWVHLVEQVEGLEQQVIGGHVMGMLTQSPAQLALANMGRDGPDELERDAVLQLEELGHLAIVVIGADHRAVLVGDEFGADPDMAAV